ncbi:MAG: prolyl oligopeptidase family serine peptidase [Halorubrum sp.]
MSRSDARIDPPETRREVVTETLHGVDIEDPYRWLENDSEAVDSWVDRQNEYADAHLQTPTSDRLRPRFEGLAEVADYGQVVVREDRYFTTVRDPTDDHARLEVRAEPDGEGTVLVDPNAWPGNDPESGDPPRSMGWFAPAHDGDHVAVGVTEGGDENYDIHVFSTPDTASIGGDAPSTPDPVTVLERRGRVNASSLAWTADGDGFYYVATGEADAGAQMDKEVRRCRLVAEDDETAADTPTETVLFKHDDQHVWPALTVDPDSGLLAVGFSEMMGGTTWYVYVDDGLRPVLPDSDAETSVRFHDGTAFLHTDHEAPRNRLLACEVERFREGDLSFDACREVLPERESILQSAVPADDRLVVHTERDAHSRLAVHDRDGTHRRDLDLPDYATVTWTTAARDAPEAFYGITGFDRPSAVTRVDLDAERRETVAAVDVSVPADLVVEQAFVDSTDGATVPVFVCYRADVSPDGDGSGADAAERDVPADDDTGGNTPIDAPRPAVLYGYGGFRNSVTPSFSRFRLPFLADGGVFAVVCARGGYEYGEAWHEAGMLEHKQHTFDDFIAAGEWLVDSGYTDSDRLGVAGGSNGGLSVGAVCTQRPDLFGAVQCEVPLLDMLRFHRFLLGESWTTEYGHPEDDSDAFAYLREYSPYHNVASGVEYPPVLFRTAASDTRVHPSHARKMAARMQAEAEGGPFILRTKSDTGHGVGRPTSMIVDEQVEAWTFLYEALDVGDGSNGADEH